RRFASDEVVAFNRAQADVIRAHAPGRTILHNYMGRELAYDHFAVGADLDAASWDSYPLGFLEDRLEAPPDHKRNFARQGDPDFQAFHHDLYRAVGKGRWWVMEQQPGPVNWAPRNPAPQAGMVRLWGFEAFAHGAEVVSYFRWRQAPFAQEQMHAGLLTPDSADSPAVAEVTALARDLSAFTKREAPTPAPVAIVFDYPSAWAWDTTPHGAEFSYFGLVFSAYRALRRLGLSVDFLDGDMAGIDNHRLVLTPGLFTVSDAARERLATTRTKVVLGPRTGSKTKDFQIPPGLPPGLGAMLDVKVSAVESLRPDMPVEAGDGAFSLWREHLLLGPAAETLGLASDGWPIAARQGPLTYIAGWPDDALWQALLKPELKAAGVATLELPSDVRVRDNGTQRHLTNYGSSPCNIAALAPNGLILGEPELGPSGIAIARL
ncbi:MAG: beta-galactosidase, partial [Pseudomonadota bacterium]